MYMRYAVILLPTSDFKFYSTDGCKPFPDLHDQEDFFHKGDYFLRDFIFSLNYQPIVLKVVIAQLTFSLKVKSLSR